MSDRVELIFRHSPIAMAVTQREDGTIIDVNEACCRLLGRSRGQLLGQRSTGAGAWASPEERAAVVARVTTGERITHHETRLAGGQHVRLSIEPFTSNGDVACLLVIIEDITDWRAAEAALRESEARWKFALEGSDSEVWDWNAVTNQVFFSDRWKAMLGYAPDEVGTSLDEWSSRVHPDDLAETMASVQAHLDGRTPEYVSEHRLRCKDGGYRWILDRGQVVTRDAEGRALRVVGTHTDITARRQTEARRLDQERRFRAIFDSTFQFIGLLTPDGILLEANRTALDFTGIRAEDVVGRPFWEARWWTVDEATPQQLRRGHRAGSDGRVRALSGGRPGTR